MYVCPFYLLLLYLQLLTMFLLYLVPQARRVLLSQGYSLSPITALYVNNAPIMPQGLLYCPLQTILMELPKKVSHSTYVKDFFQAKPGDYQLDS